MIFNIVTDNNWHSDRIFSVVISATEPSSPLDRTIWVKSGTASGEWAMVDDPNYSPSTDDGYVVIAFQVANPTTVFSYTLGPYHMAIDFSGVYQRSNGAWAKVDAYWRDGTQLHQISTAG